MQVLQHSEYHIRGDVSRIFLVYSVSRDEWGRHYSSVVQCNTPTFDETQPEEGGRHGVLSILTEPHHAQTCGLHTLLPQYSGAQSGSLPRNRLDENAPTLTLSRIP
jgi:hypothetical protein